MPMSSTLSFNNLASRELEKVFIYLSSDQQSVALSVLLQGRSGDIEVAFSRVDCQEIIARLKSVISPGADLPADDAAYRFVNLDGSEEVSIKVTRSEDCIDFMVERSDEGNIGFQLSLKDSASLLDSLVEIVRALP